MIKIPLYPIYYKFTIHKVDSETKQSLAGAYFDVYNNSGDRVDYISPDRSVIRLKAGIYTIKETIAPIGYYLNPDPITIELS